MKKLLCFLAIIITLGCSQSEVKFKSGDIVELTCNSKLYNQVKFELNCQNKFKTTWYRGKSMLDIPLYDIINISSGCDYLSQKRVFQTCLKLLQKK